MRDSRFDIFEHIKVSWKQCIALFVMMCSSSILQSQDWRYDEFIPKYKDEILSKENLESSRMSRILRDLSFIGAYKELYRMDNSIDSTIESQMGIILKSSSVVDAKTYILSQSKEKQILIINESHHRPEHRNFTMMLLFSALLQ